MRTFAGAFVEVIGGTVPYILIGLTVWALIKWNDRRLDRR